MQCHNSYVDQNRHVVNQSYLTCVLQWGLSLQQDLSSQLYIVKKQEESLCKTTVTVEKLKMSSVQLYLFAPSPPCRSVYMTAKALDVPLDLKYLEYYKKEHLDEKFLKVGVWGR